MLPKLTFLPCFQVADLTRQLEVAAIHASYAATTQEDASRQILDLQAELSEVRNGLATAHQTEASHLARAEHAESRLDSRQEELQREASLAAERKEQLVALHAALKASSEAREEEDAAHSALLARCQAAEEALKSMSGDREAAKLAEKQAVHMLMASAASTPKKDQVSRAERQLEEASEKEAKFKSTLAAKDAELQALQRDLETLEKEFVIVSDRLAETEAALAQREAGHEQKQLILQEQLLVATSQAEEAVDALQVTDALPARVCV